MNLDLRNFLIKLIENCKKDRKEFELDIKYNLGCYGLTENDLERQVTEKDIIPYRLENEKDIVNTIICTLANLIERDKLELPFIAQIISSEE